MRSVCKKAVLTAVAVIPFVFSAQGALAAAEGDHAVAADSHQENAHPGGATDGHPPSGEAPNPLRLDPDLAIWTAVVFVVLLLVLGKFAWGPISEALGQREEYIAGNIQSAERVNEEAKALFAQHEVQLAGAADEVRELLDEARRDAEQTKSQIVAEAKSAAQAEHERGMRDLRVATDTAMKQLAETSANLAVDLAGKVVQEKITPEHQARIVRDALSKLASTEPSTN